MVMVRCQDDAETDLTEELDVALKLRAAKVRMDYSQVVIAALEQKSSTTKKGEIASSLEIIIAGATGANNCCNIILFTICCSQCLLFRKTSKMHTIMGVYRTRKEKTIRWSS
jgi:hypothetical protein